MNETKIATSTELHDAWRAVIDPEMGIDIMSMGLVYNVEVDAAHAIITHT